MNEVRSSAALEVRGLDVYYGHSHALQGVDLVLESGVFSVVGRNGMGKTTLCKAIMGLVGVSGGLIRMRGEDITRRAPAQIARLGVGYVPQGRRLWRSLSVDEHLRLAGGMRSGAWTVERIYDTFPRLAERRGHGGGQLSGGEQQMLAISRALLTNPHLLIVGLHAELEPEIDVAASGVEPKPTPAPRRDAPVRIYISNPTLPTRWSQPVPIARIEAAARTLSTQVARLDETAR